MLLMESKRSMPRIRAAKHLQRPPLIARGARGRARRTPGAALAPPNVGYRGALHLGLLTSSAHSRPRSRRRCRPAHLPSWGLPAPMGARALNTRVQSASWSSSAPRHARPVRRAARADVSGRGLPRRHRGPPRRCRRSHSERRCMTSTTRRPVVASSGCWPSISVLLTGSGRRRARQWTAHCRVAQLSGSSSREGSPSPRLRRP